MISQIRPIVLEQPPKKRSISLINVMGGLIGNVVEHYDKALFALLAPFIGPLFFIDTDPLSALIKIYGILFLCTLARPVGAFVFGYIGDNYGRKEALMISLVGMSIATGIMGCLPTYEQIGMLAPFGLLLTRLSQNFFIAGETNGAAVFVLEHTSEKYRPFVSSLVDMASMMGILAASGGIALVAYFGNLEVHWRWLMWIGAILGFGGSYFRKDLSESENFLSQQNSQKVRTIKQFCNELRQDTLSIIAISLGSGFSCITYVMAISFTNSYLTIISPLTEKQLTGSNTFLIVLDLLLLPCFGYLSIKVRKEKLMIAAALTMTLSATSLFYLLSEGSLAAALFVRMSIMIAGVCFAAPFRLWTNELIPIERRCTSINIGCSIGHFLIEAPAGLICLWLYKQTGWVSAPGMYLALTGLLAAIAITRKKSSRNVKIPQPLKIG